MAKFKNCKHRGGLNHVCDECINHEMLEKKVFTNADRIRNMTDEELAYFLCYAKREFPLDGEWMIEWLKSEVGCE